jgi:uncharacterized protein YkwD
MPTTSKCRRHRRARTTLIALTAVFASACSPALQAQLRHSSGTALAMTSAERQITDSVNHFRATHGLRALRVHPNLQSKARAWAAWMAAGHCGRDPNGTPKICHSNLASGITVAWSQLEENVGDVSPRTAVNTITAGFEHSPEHAANMLNTQINYIGVGIAYVGNFMYVTEEFMAS